MKRRRWSTGVLAVIVAICVATAPRQQHEQSASDGRVEVALTLSPMAIAVCTGAGFSVEIKI